MKVSVVLVNYNVKYFVEQCLTSLLCAAKDIPVELFVVDNDSSDGSLEYLVPRFPEVTFISNENRGFGHANNRAIAAARGEYVLLVNPDTFVGENLIADCIKLMETDGGIGGIGAQMYGSDGKFAYESRRGFPSPVTSFYKISGLCSLFPYSKRFGKYYMRYLDENQTNRIDIMSGACMFLRREALDKSGLFDEAFFMYGEDIDLSYRITLAGYTNYYLPTPMVHYKGESTKKDSLRYVYLFYDAMAIFFRKHYPHYSVVFSFLVKGTIYLRAFFSVFVRLFGRFKRFLGFKKKGRTVRLLVVGGDEMRKQVQQIAQTNNLVADHRYLSGNAYTGQLLMKELAAGGFTHIVYDTSVYSYRQVIELHVACAKEFTIEMGTYSPASGVIITSGQIYKQ